jgi:hypothetical protein
MYDRLMCFKGQINFGTAVCCEGCITEHKQAVPHSVGAERTFRTVPTGQGVRRFPQNIDANMCELKVTYIEQSKFIPSDINANSLIPNSILY